MTDAPTVFIKGSGGGIVEMSLPLHETVAEMLAKGQARRVHADGTPYDENLRPDGVPGLPTTRPALNAVKAEWVGWAVANGSTVDDAEALTKQDLIERFGQVEPGNGRHVEPPETPDEGEPPATPEQPVEPNPNEQ